MDYMRYTIVFQREPEGGFTVTVPALPGCVTYGRDLEEAKKMVVDAISGYLTSLLKHQEAIPLERDTFIAAVNVKRPARKGRAFAHA